MITNLHGSLIDQDTVVACSGLFGITGSVEGDSCNTARSSVGSVAEGAGFYRADNFGKVLL